MHESNIILTEGLNRQILWMSEALGYMIEALGYMMGGIKKLRIMNIELGRMPVGEWRFLTPKGQKQLFADLNYEVKSFGTRQKKPRKNRR